LGNTILTALANDNLASENPSCIAVPNVLAYQSVLGKVIVVTLGAESTPSQEESALVTVVSGI
jgi:hypothetical protein